MGRVVWDRCKVCRHDGCIFATIALTRMPTNDHGLRPHGEQIYLAGVLKNLNFRGKVSSYPGMVLWYQVVPGLW